MRICILIPSYNEGRTVGGIVRELRSRNETVYVVDDGSTDDTFSVAASAGATVIRLNVNMGKGAAVREGFRHIMSNELDAVLVMDGDGQHEAGSIAGFLKKMDETGADIVIGNRMSDTSSMPLIRKITNRFMSFFISRMCGQHVPDTQCGFRLIKKHVMEKVHLESSNFEIESELILKASKMGFRIESVPIRTVYQDEKSSINPIIDTLRFIVFIIKTSLKK